MLLKWNLEVVQEGLFSELIQEKQVQNFDFLWNLLMTNPTVGFSSYCSFLGEKVIIFYDQL